MTALLLCACDRATTAQPPAPAIAPAPPAAAAAFAKSFAPEVVGTIRPVAVTAGDYAMAFTRKYDAFVTTELKISDHRTGAMTISLAGDGTATACVGAKRHGVAAGQYNYEPDPGKRRHSESNSSQLRVYAGTWSVVDGVAVIRFVKSAGATCDPSKATAEAAGIELRCIGVTGSDRVPAGSLACEEPARTVIASLGMPMTQASRAQVHRGRGKPAEGPNVVLGAPGVIVEVTERDDKAPVYAFRAGTTPLVESAYVTPR